LKADSNQATLDYQAIFKFHRRSRGLIAVTPRGKWEKPIFVDTNFLEDAFPSFVSELLEDSYFSIHSFRRQKNPRRLARLAQSITYAYVDLDCYKTGLTAAEATGKATQLMDSNVLPQASILVRSGRGLWLMWLLHQGRREKAPAANTRNRDLWLQIEQELSKRFQHLGCDSAVNHLASNMRLPGSFNTKSNSQVIFTFQADSGGTGYMYTLPELRERLNIREEPKRKRKLSLVKAPTSRPQISSSCSSVSQSFQSRGWKAAVERKLRDWKTLFELRNGFGEGTRNQGLLYGTALFLQNGRNPANIIDYAERCRPAYPASETTVLMKTAKKYRLWSYQTIRDRLGITLKEAAHLEGSYYPEAKVNRAEVRREAIVGILRTNESASVRTVQRLLEELGIKAGKSIVQRDLAAMRQGQLFSATA